MWNRCTSDNDVRLAIVKSTTYHRFVMCQTREMKKKWNIEINSIDAGIDNFNCRPFLRENKLIFAFPSIDKDTINENGKYAAKISLYEIQLSDGEFIDTQFRFTQNETFKRKIVDSKIWVWTETLLDTGITINYTNGTFELDSDIKSFNTEVRTNYYFDNLEIVYNQKSTIICKNTYTNQQIWKIQVVGYLYTDITKNGNYIHFGTDGKGGAFYFIELKTGKVITTYNNRGTSFYLEKDQYIYLRSQNGTLAKIDPYNNETLQELKLSGQIYSNPITKIMNGMIVISHNLEKGLTYLNYIIDE